MSKLPLEIIEQFIDACKAGAGDAGGSLSSALDSTMQIVDVIGGEPITQGALPEEFGGPGLALIFHVGDAGLALLLPEATNLLPTWYTQPDPTGESKLQTLAQELSMLLLPEDIEVSQFAAGAVQHLGNALRAGQTADPFGCVRLSMQGDDGNGTFYMCWPVERPGAFLRKADPPTAEPAAVPEAAAHDLPTEHQDHDYASLPTYTRSLLSIRLPVVVNLASTKMSVDEILNLGQGSIIQFEKSCEDSLELEAGGHTLAAGEAVKVGDKFGLRITSIRLPNERYQTIGK